MATRDERVDDLFFEDLTVQGNPTELGQVRYVNGDIVAVVDDGGPVAKSITAGAGGGSDHGGLTGLLDDDHTQYQLRSEQSAANGYPSLDGTARLPVAELTIHNTTHEQGGVDEITSQNLGSGAATVDKFKVTDGTGGWLLFEAPAPGFGRDLYREEDLTTTSTTSTTYVTKVTLVTPSLALGDWLIFYKMNMSGTTNGTKGEVRFTVDGVEDDKQTLISGAAGDEQGFVGLEVLEQISGIKTIELQGRKVNGSGSVDMSNARVIMFRIA